MPHYECVLTHCHAEGFFTPDRVGDGAVAAPCGASFFFEKRGSELNQINHHLMSKMIHLKERVMRTTLNLDDALLKSAMALTGIEERNQLVREALRALIAREAGRRLIALGGTDPQAQAAPRRRSTKVVA